MRYLFLLLLASCVHVPTPLETRCRPILGEILAVQDERNLLSDEMGEVTKAFKEGKVSAEKHRALFGAWVASENRLRGHVTGLYDTAYREGCL